MPTTYESAAKTLPQYMAYGNWPSSKQGAWQPASATQFNDVERDYGADRVFSLQGERMMRPCPNGRGQACAGTRLEANRGGSHLPKAVNSTFLGSQTDMSNMGFRPNYSATVLEGSMARAAAYQLVSQEAFDGSLDGSYGFCSFNCPKDRTVSGSKSEPCGWCTLPPIAERDPGATLFKRGQSHRHSKSPTAHQKVATRVH